jgi:acyl carrier protein
MATATGSYAATELNNEDVLRKVIGVLQSITSERDTAFSGGIDADTCLVRDLDCDSTDLVAFALELEVCFGRRDISIEKLFMVDGRYRDDLSAGQVASFLCEQLAGRTAP